MELKHYRLIKTIVEEGSIANSSEKLFLTQSALSHQLREMEERLGFRVFVRTRNNWELTDQGKELYQLSKTIFAAVDQSFEKIEYINRGSTGKIRIATECYSFYQGLPLFISKMGVLYPNIEVEIVIEATHQPIPKLLSKDIDIAIATYVSNAPEIEKLELHEDEVVCVLHKSHPLANEPYLEARHFSDVHLIIHSFPLETVAVYTHLLKIHKIVPQKITAVPFLSVVFEMISVNMGVICLPENILDSFKISDQVIVKRIGKNGLKRRNHLLFRKEDKQKQHMKDFIANIRENFL